jgi:Transposase DDE domain
LHRQYFSSLLGLKEPLYAMDSTTISLCLNLFTWAYFRSTKAAVKAHTVLDLRGTIPVFIAITTGDIPDNKLLDSLKLPAHATVVLDRGYVDFTRLYALAQNKLRFVVRAKDNLHCRRVQSRRVDTSTGLRADDTIWLVNKKSRRAYPRRLRRIEFYDTVNDVELVLLTNRFDLPALTIAQIYKERWKIELFFKWLKQNLTVKHFFGNSENAVRSQIWIAICVYLIVLIVHKQLRLEISLQLLLHLIEVNIFEHISLQDLVTLAQSPETPWPDDMQMSLL